MSEKLLADTIEVDPSLQREDATSDYASTGYATDSTSLNSSVRDFVFENGRKYQTYFGVGCAGCGACAQADMRRVDGEESPANRRRRV